VQQATQFLDRLESFGVPLAGVLVNRIRLWPFGDPPAESLPGSEVDLAKLREALTASQGKTFPAQLAAEAAAESASGYAALVRSDARSTQRLRERTEEQNRFWGCIPEFDHDVHDFVSLGRVADRIAGRERETDRVGE
jgi:hypothetical protein